MHIVWLISNNSSAPYFSWFAERAAKEGKHRITFINLFPSKPDMIEEMHRFGFRCYWIPYDYHKRKRGMFFAFFKLLVLFLRLRPDVVHSHLFDDAVPSLLAARLTRINKRVITKADTTFHYYHYPIWVWADRFNNFNSTHIIAISNESAQFVLEKEKANSGKLTVIHHGLPLEVISKSDSVSRQELSNKFGLQGKFVIGSVSRFIEWKGYKYIVEAAAQLVNKYPDLLFLFSGNGPQEQEIRDLVKKKELEKNIVFTGWIENKQMPSLYSLMNIFLHAASFEPFGFVIAEAMANGIPVLSTATGAALDGIEHKKSGYLIRPKDAHQIVEGIEYLRNADLKTMGQEAQIAAHEKFPFEKMYSLHIDLYTSNKK